MGYSAAIFLNAILLAPIVLFAAWALWQGSIRFFGAPGGWRGLPVCALTMCSGYAALFLFGSMQILVTGPASLQQQYLGRVYAGPLALRRLEHWGLFMDPATQWTWALPASTLGELKQRCTRGDPVAERDRCYLYGATDEQWFAYAWLEKDELVLVDGLH